MARNTLKRTELALLLLLALILGFATSLEKQQQRIAGSLIRLHISANSDSREDQQIKLQVRDAVLEEASSLLQDAHCREDALTLLQNQLPALEQRANETLQACGTSDLASVALRRELFGTRTYQGFALPGGYYDALRISIGRGEGHNWWCVVYPQICTAATADDRRAAEVMAGMDETSMEILECDTPEYELRFRVLELFENLMGWFRATHRGIPDSG